MNLKIRSDDITVMKIIDEFTLAQVMEFITAAQEAQASNVLAAIMEYKNNKYPDFDPMSEFTLDL